VPHGRRHRGRARFADQSTRGRGRLRGIRPPDLAL